MTHRSSPSFFKIFSAHVTHSFAAVCLLLLLTGCGKRSPVVHPNAQPIKPLTCIPPQLEAGNHFIKHKLSYKPVAASAQAPAILRLILSLRDAARNNAHIIAPLAQGTLLTHEELPVHITATTTLHDHAYCMRTRMRCYRQDDSMLIAVETHDTVDAQKPTFELTLAPTGLGAIFQAQFLDLVFDTISTGYASNEVSLALTHAQHTIQLCRQGCTSTMEVELLPTQITIKIDGYSPSPREFLHTMLKIPAQHTKPIQKEVVMPKNALFVLMPHGFQDIEFTDPYNALNAAGCHTDVAGLSSGTCIGTQGTVVTPTKLLSTMRPADFDQYDAVVIPGGMASPEFLWNNEEVQAVVRYFHEHKKLVATICYASIVPAQAGLLCGKRATTYPTDETKKLFADNQVIFDDQLCIELEKDNIITAQRPRAVQPFTAALLKHLAPSSMTKESVNG
jgi:protease I